MKTFNFNFCETAVAESYRAMERIQRSMETLIREQTPFQGLQDLDAFESHLKSLSHQKRASMEEIARLTQLNRGEFRQTE